MASYFDLKPTNPSGAAAAEAVDIPDDEAFGKMSFLSPQVTRILDDLPLDEKSSSDDENASLSRHGDTYDKAANDDRKSQLDKAEKQSTANEAQTPPSRHATKSVHIAAPTHHRPGLGSAQKHPHLARFHSLRSILFSSQIENNMEQCKEIKEKEEAEKKWKSDHESRRGYNRPKTPESPPKEGFTRKIGNKIRRMTSREVPTVKQINESGDNESTASSEEEDEQNPPPKDDGKLDHSDVEELVRWVSRKDPPSDGEKRRIEAKVKDQGLQDDSGHESLGHSDIEELVRWVSRKENVPKTKPSDVLPEKESVGHKESTDGAQKGESEAEASRKGSINEDDVDDLVRWVSRREGISTEPVQENAGSVNKIAVHPQEEHSDELVRWITHKDDASGESDVPDEHVLRKVKEKKTLQGESHSADSNLKLELSQPETEQESKTGLTHEDVDELVQWVSRKNTDQKQVEIRGGQIAD